ncbi:tRNA (uracil-5-)-methyltransferase Gid [Spiroplasma sp. TIUS-1]|uniref:methylenetetrahydrofolate--tRNA-(uracil(54)- C(5))-methyltransferase (FADH(2)-oxidizing) TrmFO n=1 Tax=Spiroplasma sp. TIUS-1 TaxID=216963 RepID=UPI0013993501|nr:methylenetetrahydrofolate--tRNA-(uracil(54)-C(5))-methyltransferase (FADH(2)-oxidizing) TrmFO [Spiroplasma sp. TIUS-1]QHX36199.1 tRNA (uracil-5-)-methyltransferase Gid [Spiroplasma sp. TIUS-1]
MKIIKVIGAGLAGCEAAWQLSKAGYKVKLYESKTIQKNEIQKIETIAELVCSNTLRSKSIKNAVGILKKEMELFDSLIIEAAIATQIPSDDALAVDRINFSKYIQDKIMKNENIELINEVVETIDDENEITIVAVGPLLSDSFNKEIQRVIGNQKLYFMDASAPIVEKSSIDFEKVYFSTRHKGEGKYICIPLNEDQFNNFRNELINGQVVQTQEFENEVFFKGCQPIEHMAKSGKNVLLNGTMSPSQLEDENGNLPFAVVQLRQDDAIDTLYNFVGFQTNLKWPEQTRILRTLPGMEKINIVRFGVMHKNKYINSPKILNHKLQVKRKRNVFFAGQITGVEGYVESAMCGIVAAMGVVGLIQNKKVEPLPVDTVMGALIKYITNENLKKFNPMKANMGILQHPGIKKSEMPEDWTYTNSIDKLKKYINNKK